MKISATEIVKNLHFPNGTAIIPRGSVVYISTDDPDGICKNCLFNRKPCDSYPIPKPVGCPEDVSLSPNHTLYLQLLHLLFAAMFVHCCSFNVVYVLIMSYSLLGMRFCALDGRFGSCGIIKKPVTSPTPTRIPLA